MAVLISEMLVLFLLRWEKMQLNCTFCKAYGTIHALPLNDPWKCKNKFGVKHKVWKNAFELVRVWYQVRQQETAALVQQYITRANMCIWRMEHNIHGSIIW